MTYLSAASIMIDNFGRGAAPALNPELDMARMASAGARSGGILGWLGRTAIGKALIARKSDRDLNAAVMRLSELSPHLLADIGMLDTVAVAEDLPQTDVRTARPPVAPRPAHRPAIQVQAKAPASATTKPPVRAARKEARVAQ